MINERDVLRMKVPYPSVDSKLAASSHMYICQNAKSPHYSFVKCQTLKPYMLVNNTMKHYCDEQPDRSRNPFQKVTRIDCDKLFSTHAVSYHDSLKTTIRDDVCVELYRAVERELYEEGYLDIPIHEGDLVKLNVLVNKI